MKRKTNWKVGLATALLGFAMTAPVNSNAQSTGYPNGYVIRNTSVPRATTWSNWNGWYNSGYQSTSYYDNRYGWVRKDTWSDGSYRYYTFGYQVVYVWTSNGYVETIHNGNFGVAYPVVYGSRS